MVSSTDFWDKRAGRYDAKLYKGPNYAARLERAGAVFGEGDYVLDVGCASGEITLDLAGRAGRGGGVLGIDQSAKMVEVARAKARERGVANARFEQMEAADPRLGVGAFNVVTAYSVIHLLEDGQATVARLGELLVPGGYLITETPCLGDWNIGWRVLVKLAVLVGVAPRVVSLKVAELESMIAGAGFEVIESKVYNPKSGMQCVLARKR